MALIKCPECGKEISDQAAACPSCGYPIAQQKTVSAAPVAEEADSKPAERTPADSSSKFWVILIAIVVTLAFVSYRISERSVDKRVDELLGETASSVSSGATKSQKNAVKKAKLYLDTMAFSHDGLVEQLEYEGYSNADAVYGADHCGADWNEQAAKKAKAYLDLMPYSRQGLIDQLIFEGFTKEQAAYGVKENGL